MQSKIVFFTILVAVHVNYITSIGVRVNTCKSDEECCNYLSILKTGIVPIYLIEDMEDYPANLKTMTELYDEKHIKDMLIVPADLCPQTSKLLVSSTKEMYDPFPSTVFIKNSKLFSFKVKSTTIYKLGAAVTKVTEETPDGIDDEPIDIQLRGKIELAKREGGEGTNDRQTQPVIPTGHRQTLSQSAYPPATSVQAQTANRLFSSGRPKTNAEHSGQLRRLQPAINSEQSSLSNWLTGTTQPNARARAPVSDTAVHWPGSISPGWPQTNAQHSGQLRRSQPAINLGQPSSANRFTTDTTRLPTRAWAPVSDTTVLHRPRSALAINPRTSVGVPTIRSTIPKTLDLFKDEPGRLLETRNQLSSFDQHQQGDQNNNASGSNLPPTAQALYFQYDDDESSRKKKRTNGNFPIVSTR